MRTIAAEQPPASDEKLAAIEVLDVQLSLLWRRARAINHQLTRSVHPDIEPAAYGLLSVLLNQGAMRLTELVTPLKPLEAMAQGRLVVASDVGGHRELIEHGRTGVLFRAGDADALAHAVSTLLRETSAWPALRSRARSFVGAQRTWDASVGRYAPVYARLTDAAGTPP